MNKKSMSIKLKETYKNQMIKITSTQPHNRTTNELKAIKICLSLND